MSQSCSARYCPANKGNSKRQQVPRSRASNGIITTLSSGFAECSDSTFELDLRLSKLTLKGGSTTHRYRRWDLPASRLP
eukprot:m.362455 g.362455  ORF g.362455 m.362455 type:complete len:79 (+) comp16649_c1_seq30:482-718(+)